MENELLKNGLISYDDVTLIPSHSSLSGRDECDVSVNILGEKYKMPIILAPMITLTTPEMIWVFYNNNLIPTLHRYFKGPEEQYNYLKFGVAEIVSRHQELSEIKYGEITTNTIVPGSFLNTKVREAIEYTYFAVGGIKKHKDWIDTLIDKYSIKRFLVDFANGDTDECIETCKYIKERVGESSKIISGNYATWMGCYYNMKYADIFRIGIGGRHCCSTRRDTGFGTPTLSSLLEDDMYDRAFGLVIADGGIKSNGDIAKAMAANADLVMCGYLFAGTSCAMRNKKGECVYMGMASAEAKSLGGLKLGSIEGESGAVKDMGSTQFVIDRMYENLKSSLAYAGCKNWKEFQATVKMKKISMNGYFDGLPRLNK